MLQFNIIELILAVARLSIHAMYFLLRTKGSGLQVAPQLGRDGDVHSTS